MVYVFFPCVVGASHLRAAPAPSPPRWESLGDSRDVARSRRGQLGFRVSQHSTDFHIGTVSQFGRVWESRYGGGSRLKGRLPEFQVRQRSGLRPGLKGATLLGPWSRHGKHQIATRDGGPDRSLVVMTGGPRFWKLGPGPPHRP